MMEEEDQVEMLAEMQGQVENVAQDLAVLTHIYDLRAGALPTHQEFLEAFYVGQMCISPYIICRATPME